MANSLLISVRRRSAVCTRSWRSASDSLYCDIIADRFQRFSGVPAVLERTGDSLIPMKAREKNMR